MLYNFENLKGKIITDIFIDGKSIKECKKTSFEGSDEIIFITSEGKKYKMHHNQNCCENVSIEDINGDLRDLLEN